MTLRPLLTLPSLALETSAKALRFLAFTNEVLAARFAAPAAPQSIDRPVPAPRPASAASTAAASQAETAPAPEDIPRDIPTLADRTAPDIVTALDSLGMAELADLYDYESKNRRRRSVLSAIDAALAPPATAASDEELIDEVRVPDELVYSTSTPRR